MPLVALIAAVASALSGAAGDSSQSGASRLTQIGSAFADFLTKSKFASNSSDAISNAKSVGNGRF